MAYRVLDNVTNIFHDYDTFREAYDACVNDDNKTTISFNDMDWKWKTKEEILVNEDHLENLSEEYRNEQEQDVGYWVCVATNAPNHNEILDLRYRLVISEDEMNNMLDCARIIEIVNEYTFMNRFGYFD